MIKTSTEGWQTPEGAELPSVAPHNGSLRTMLHDGSYYPKVIPEHKPPVSPDP